MANERKVSLTTGDVTAERNDRAKSQILDLLTTTEKPTLLLAVLLVVCDILSGSYTDRPDAVIAYFLFQRASLPESEIQ